MKWSATEWLKEHELRMVQLCYKKIQEKDFVGAKTLASRALRLFHYNENTVELFKKCELYCSNPEYGENRDTGTSGKAGFKQFGIKKINASHLAKPPKSPAKKKEKNAAAVGGVSRSAGIRQRRLRQVNKISLRETTSQEVDLELRLGL